MSDELKQDAPFIREERYIVIKRKHLSKDDERNLEADLAEAGIPTIGAVVVESDWPEYEPTWRAIEGRVTRASTPPDTTELVGAEDPDLGELAPLYNPTPGDMDSLVKFDGVGDHAETVETRARIGERYLEAYESALSDPRLVGYCPADCPSELLLDLLHGERLSAPATELVGRLREAISNVALDAPERIGDSEKFTAPVLTTSQTEAVLSAVLATLNAGQSALPTTPSDPNRTAPPAPAESGISLGLGEGKVEELVCQLRELMAKTEFAPWQVVRQEYESGYGLVAYFTIETVGADSQLKAPLPVISLAKGIPAKDGDGSDVPVIWMMRETADLIVEMRNALPALLSAASGSVADGPARVAMVDDHNAAFDTADEVLGGAFGVGFREGWIFAQDPDNGIFDDDYDNLVEQYNREVDIEPMEAWQGHRDEFFAKLPLAAIPEVGSPLPTAPVGEG